MSPQARVHFKKWLRACLVAQVVKNLPAVQETQVWSLYWEDPMEKGMATHSSILAWRIAWTDEPGRLQSMGLHRVRYNWATDTFTFHFDVRCNLYINELDCAGNNRRQFYSLLPPLKMWWMKPWMGPVTLVVIQRIKFLWSFSVTRTVTGHWILLVPLSKYPVQCHNPSSPYFQINLRYLPFPSLSHFRPRILGYGEELWSPYSAYYCFSWRILYFMGSSQIISLGLPMATPFFKLSHTAESSQLLSLRLPLSPAGNPYF